MAVLEVLLKKEHSMTNENEDEERHTRENASLADEPLPNTNKQQPSYMAAFTVRFRLHHFDNDVSISCAPLHFCHLLREYYYINNNLRRLISNNFT